jgi:hypothetical protein
LDNSFVQVFVWRWSWCEERADVEGGEPIQAWLVGPVIRLRRWYHEPPDPHLRRWVTVGRLDDGRWFVEIGERCRAYTDEATAQDVADREMAGAGPWVEIPAAYDAHGQPATPGPWARIGAGWRRPVV